MKLSIVIPVYRTQDTLDRCLQSILQQSFTDYEIILVDDGSPDECPQLCDAYAQQDKRIKVVHKTNGGLSDARNAGIAKAQGEYITFVDSDDAIQEDTLLPLVNELYQHHDVDILEYPIWERVGHPTRERLLSFSPHTYANTLEYWFMERGFNHTYACNKIFRRTLFDKIFFPKGKNFEDVLTIPKLLGLHFSCQKSPVIRVTHMGCYRYYWNDKSITANAKYEDFHCLYEGHCQTLEYIRQEIGGRQDLLKKYSNSLQDFMAQMLNILLDLYELSGRYEQTLPLINDVENIRKVVRIKPIKLRMLLIFGYYKLCRINKYIHRIYRHH